MRDKIKKKLEEIKLKHQSLISKKGIRGYRHIKSSITNFHLLSDGYVFDDGWTAFCEDHIAIPILKDWGKKGNFVGYKVHLIPYTNFIKDAISFVNERDQFNLPKFKHIKVCDMLVKKESFNKEKLFEFYRKAYRGNEELIEHYIKKYEVVFTNAGIFDDRDIGIVSKNENITLEEKIVLEDVLFEINKICEDEVKKSDLLEEELRNEDIRKLNVLKNQIISELDKDGNGTLDTIEVKDDFLKILKKHQSKISEVDKSYIQQFVKVSEYHKSQRKNLQTIFENITINNNKNEINSLLELLKENIHSYEILILHSFNMLISLIDDDLVTFYQIHTAFDKLDIFNSNHQNQLMNKLSNIEDGLYSLILSIRSMEQNIIYELNHLSYVTESSYEKLSISVNENLKAIGSSINTNNLLTAINTYQNYSTNRRLNS